MTRYLSLSSIFILVLVPQFGYSQYIPLPPGTVKRGNLECKDSRTGSIGNGYWGCDNTCPPTKPVCIQNVTIATFFGSWVTGTRCKCYSGKEADALLLSDKADEEDSILEDYSQAYSEKEFFKKCP